LVIEVDDPSSALVMADLNRSLVRTMYHEKTIGLRCPDDPVAEGLLRAAGGPVVATSANPAGFPPPWTGEEVLKELDGRIDLLVDTGRTKHAKPSTIVRVSGSSYKVVREGVFDAGIVERLSTLVLLYVCTGNTCRSPMAAAFARKMLAERIGCGVADLPRRGIEVQSVGTAGGGGGASPHAVEVMARRGIDLSDHASAALTSQTVRQADYIFAMTGAHRDTIVRMVPSAEDRVRLLLDDGDVRDPIGGSEEDYERCARTVEKGLYARLQEVIL
jgi:protein-tyrosine phosphatase